ncbi:hypothetical protein [Microbacterium sp. SLBN-111]|uniref:hypothetical protein n=1 Tax=Microbacterium sp. SLBN-111 TaxID=3377733 RepID=UPI003C7538A7
MNSPVPGYLLTAVGGLLVVIGLIWGAVVGFYPRDLPLLLGLLVVGGILAYIGQRQTTAFKRAEAERRIAERNAGRD